MGGARCVDERSSGFKFSGSDDNDAGDGVGNGPGSGGICGAPGAGRPAATGPIDGEPTALMDSPTRCAFNVAGKKRSNPPRRAVLNIFIISVMCRNV